jgi:ATP-dependent DNA helicase RecG
MEISKIEEDDINALLNLNEAHFNDVKIKRIAPAKLQETFVAFANSDGGDLYIGIEDKSHSGERLIGFDEQEEASVKLITAMHWSFEVRCF